MNGFFHEKGILSVSIGEGLLSSFEAGSLKPGDVVRTTKMAGVPVTLSFNGAPMAQCEVVILDDLFAVRLCDMDPPRDLVPAPGARDDLVELLPISVSLGSIRVSLNELKGIGIHSIVSLGKPFGSAADLLVAGMPMARGEVVVIEEEFGMKITEILGPGFQDENVRASGYILDPASPRRVKTYDFKRPDRFSRNEILKLTEIHLFFLRNMQARFQDVTARAVHAHPVIVDQCTYAEAMEELRKLGDFNCLVVENWPARRTPLPDDRPRYAPLKKLIVEEEGTAHPVSASSRAHLERWIADFGVASNRNPVLIYSRKGGPMDRLMARKEDAAAVLSCLRGGWRNVADLNLRPAPEGEAFLRDVPIHKQEMVITVGIPGEGKDSPELCIVYPYFTLEPLQGVLA